MNKVFIFFILISELILAYSCNNGGNQKVETSNQWNDSISVGFNKDRVKEEELQINLYLKHREKLKMKSTGTGLRYQIVNDNSGIPVMPGDSVDVDMKISLLDGNICYKTDSTELDQFLVDRSQVESGVHEGVKLMKEGQKAIFILTSNLAHGLLGDFKKIPPMSPIVVELEVVKVIKNGNKK
jgi:FKBP-type peptidyl-prolyl cis-trans isomerase